MLFILSKFEKNPIKLARVIVNFVCGAKRKMNMEDGENTPNFEGAYFKRWLKLGMEDVQMLHQMGYFCSPITEVHICETHAKTHTCLSHARMHWLSWLHDTIMCPDLYMWFWVMAFVCFMFYLLSPHRLN